MGIGELDNDSPIGTTPSGGRVPPCPKTERTKALGMHRSKSTEGSLSPIIFLTVSSSAWKVQERREKQKKDGIKEPVFCGPLHTEEMENLIPKTLDVCFSWAQRHQSQQPPFLFFHPFLGFLPRKQKSDYILEQLIIMNKKTNCS